MSNRHRSAEDKPAKFDRRTDHHRERQALRLALAAAGNPEDVIDPRTHHSLHAEHALNSDPVGDRPRRRFRHWKAPFWKRRTTVRHARNQLIARLQLDD